MFLALRLIRRLVALIALVVVCVLGVTAFRVWHTGRTDSHPHSDVLLVEGAAQYNGRPSAILQARLQHALDLWHEQVAPRIITVGGRRTGDEFTEGGTGATWLRAHGVPSADAVAVEQGSDTLLSLRAVEVVMRAHGWHSAVLVTDPWHELRSRAIARDIGMRAASSPVTDGPATRGLGTQVRYIGRETVAYLYYRVTGRASRAGPSAV